MLLYYEAMFTLSLTLSLIYTAMWHKHFDIHFALIFAIIPVSNLGYIIVSHSETMEAAIWGRKVVYIGGCFLMLFIMQSIIVMCHLRVSRLLNAGLLCLSMLVYESVLMIGYSDIFYKDCVFVKENGVSSIEGKTYGFMHTVFYIMIIVYLVRSIAAMMYGYFKKKSVSRKMIYLMFIPVAVTYIAFFFEKKLITGLSLVPAAYVAAQVVYLLIISRLCLYDITDSAIDSIVQTGDTGFISFDRKFNYLGSNGTARKIFPDLSKLTVDRPISESVSVHDSFIEWLTCFKANEFNDKFYYKTDKRTYLVDVNFLFNGKHKIGYQFVVTDDTKNQQYITLLNNYNIDLKDQVEEKTEHIVEMHDRLIMSMAAMVESRDNSTGGHIRRTSDVVKMLVDEIKKDNDLHLSDEFCKDLIKAAPMHDLGKIAVDDAILRKPGRFTDEEYEIMKTHAAEGAKIVHQILEGTDDIDFHVIAENVAHYHHERWDGSGYPEGLKGEEIPIEARIMAIADVYDALVSKRVYKESMPFDKADAIIMDGMGKHFDKQLEKYYVAARPRLEEYYRTSE